MAVKVLILEDNPTAREFLGRVVRESFSDTITIVEAGDLENARRQIRIAGGAQGYHGVDPFKLVLVDLELPDGSGLELLEELRQYPATKIVTTLYSDDEHLFPALQVGADGYLLKEDRFELLVEELQKIVRGEPPLSPAIARRLLAHFRTTTRSGMNRRITDEGNGSMLRPEFAGGFTSAMAIATPAPVEIEPPLDLPALTPREVEVLTFPEQGLHDQGDRGADDDQVVHGQRPHQVDLPQAQRLEPR
jgi:DNA-binding NarL/FixJ family response regulator